MGKSKCSFCGKDESEVAKLVAGPGGRGSNPRVYICDECLEKAGKLISKKKSSSTVTPLK